ncbi:unnamed protein product [Fusarium graminearum]|uniref:Uncharacterized protein n=1 Tax=Gibberella zeae TaxID=5518 RepID=A0A4E9DSD8_GIBZA|nr:unnamed protein product [Fusarium graminearum]CAF3645321.1 unnamed protein product [Fusarium graminearum]CAG1979706.1 unnamed protein product [Fusarium graminearum]CAG2011161.1 unnamed protein product [Fusarium graminearum]
MSRLQISRPAVKDKLYSLGNLDWGLGSIENYLDGNGQLQSRVTFARMDRFNRTNHVKDQKGLFLPTSRPHPNQGDHSGTGNGIHLSLVRHFRNEVHRWMDGFIQIMALILRRKKDLRMRYPLRTCLDTDSDSRLPSYWLTLTVPPRAIHYPQLGIMTYSELGP